MDLSRAVATARLFSGVETSAAPGSSVGRVAAGPRFITATSPTGSATVWIDVPGLSGCWSLPTRIAVEAASRSERAEDVAIDIAAGAVRVGRWKVATDVRSADATRPDPPGAVIADPVPSFRLAAVLGVSRATDWRAVALVGGGALVVDETRAVASGDLSRAWRTYRSDCAAVAAALGLGSGATHADIGSDRIVLSRGDVIVSTVVPVVGPEHAAAVVETSGERVDVVSSVFRDAVARVSAVGTPAWIDGRLAAVGRGVAVSAPAGGRVRQPVTLDPAVAAFLAARPGDIDVRVSTRNGAPDRVVLTVGGETLVVQSAVPDPDVRRAAAMA